MKFRFIAADPPWQHNSRHSGNDFVRGLIREARLRHESTEA